MKDHLHKITSLSFPSYSLFSYTKSYINKATTPNCKLQPAFHTTKIYARYPLVEDPSNKTENNPAVSVRGFIFKFAYNNSMPIFEGYGNSPQYHCTTSISEFILFCMPFLTRFKIQQRISLWLVNFLLKLLNKHRRTEP